MRLAYSAVIDGIGDSVAVILVQLRAKLLAVQFVVTPVIDIGSPGNGFQNIQLSRTPSFTSPAGTLGLVTGGVLAQTVVSATNDDNATLARLVLIGAEALLPCSEIIDQSTQLYISTDPSNGPITVVNGVVNLYVE